MKYEKRKPNCIPIQCFKNRTGPAGPTGWTVNRRVQRSGLTPGPDMQSNRTEPDKTGKNR
jgi:hypothetical protein